MTLNDAYNKVFNTLYPNQYSPICVEDKTHYIFYPRPMNIGPNERFYSGTIFPSVNKNTGNIEEYDVINDTLEEPIKKYVLNVKNN